MRSKVTSIQQLTAFERVLDALAEELIESTDDEILEAARALGMEPTMRGSAAFIGLKYPAIPRMSDFFELPATARLAIHTGRSPAPEHGSEKQAPARNRRRKRHSPGDEDP